MSLRSALVKKLVTSPIALRARVIREQQSRFIPDEPENPFRRTGKVGILTDAIEFRQRVSFMYTNKTEPQRSGRRVGMYTSPGSASATGRLPSWRTFLLSRVSRPEIIENKITFGQGLQQFRIAPGYRRFRLGRFIVRV
jgi:hypothetical protein